MSKLGIGQKASRVLKFLMGVRHPRVARALVNYGFSQEHLEDGWDRLREVTRIRLDEEEAPRSREAEEALDAFENLWFVIAKAVLQHRYPVANQALFHNLKQGSGNDVTVTVAIFLTRLGQMEAGNGKFESEGPAARDVLRERGLTDDIVEEIRVNVQRLRSWEAAPELPIGLESRKESEDHMWAWYLEWSAIARVSVSDRRLLRGMGFLNTSKRASQESEDDEVEEPKAASVIVTSEEVAKVETERPRALPPTVAAPVQPLVGQEDVGAAE